MIKVVGREVREIPNAGRKEIREIAKDNDLSPERYIALLNGKPVTWERYVSEDENLSFVEVFSGG